MTTVYRRVKKPPLWAKCLVASLAVHSAALYLLIENPILLNKSWGSFFSPSKPLPKHISADESWEPETLSIQHFFEEFPTKPKKVEASSKTSLLAAISPSEEIKEDITVNLPSSFFLKETNSSQNEKEVTLPSLVALKDEPLLLKEYNFDPPALSKSVHIEPTLHEISLEIKADSPLKTHHIPMKKDVIPSRENVRHGPFNENNYALDESQGAFPISTHDPFVKPAESFTVSIDESKLPLISSKASQQDLAPSSLSEINDYLPEELIAAIEWNNDFNISSSVFPDKDGYVFSLVVTPKEDLSKQKIKQNFYFLIDNSSEVENHKLSVFKRSVSKALSALQQGDSFNILLIDRKTTKLSPTNLIVSPQNLRLAETFLESSKGERPLFSSLNLKKNLEELLTFIDTEEEVHTAILLSNGKSTLDPKDLSQFLKKNHGKLNIFSAAVGQNNQLTFLDMISSFCGGSLFYSETNASFPRKLSLFVKNLHAPLAKNLSVSVHATHPNAELELASISGQMPNLYNNEPFVIMGRIDRLCDLDLVIQGNSAEDQIFLKKVIHFDQAINPENSIKKQWLVHQKGFLYNKFLNEAKPTHLKSAKEILKAIHGRAFAE
jgi:hypothetical protein